jgi:SRSO17 transposase
MEIIQSLEIEEKYAELINRLSGVFVNVNGLNNARNYITGLLGSSERKNGWQLSESIGESKPYRVQQFLYRGVYESADVRDELQSYVVEKLGEAEGVLVVDDTGFIKQGDKSCGVQRQYTGTLGKICNCQLGVFLSYASSKGQTPIDCRLYMPKVWMDDKERRLEAGVPEDLEFSTKPELALEMIQEAASAGMPYKWATGDCAYGDYDRLRKWLEENNKCYVLNISSKEYIDHEHIGTLLSSLPKDGWFEASCGAGSKGERLYDWLIVPASGVAPEGFKRVILVRRSKSDPEGTKAYISFAPTDTPELKLVEVAGTRWTVETCFKESKGEVGLDHYEVRSYDGWYKHVTFAMVALAFLSVMSANSLDTKTFAEHNPASSSLDEFKKGRNLRV